MSDTPAAELELLAVGRISVDLYAEQIGAPVERVETFRKSIGGTTTNVAGILAAAVVMDKVVGSEDVLPAGR